MLWSEWSWFFWFLISLVFSFFFFFLFFKSFGTILSAPTIIGITVTLVPQYLLFMYCCQEMTRSFNTRVTTCWYEICQHHWFDAVYIFIKNSAIIKIKKNCIQMVTCSGFILLACEHVHFLALLLKSISCFCFLKDIFLLTLEHGCWN